VGQIKILDLRQKAMARLGKDFDIRQFHNVALTNGALPLGILERVVDDWIASRAKAPPPDLIVYSPRHRARPDPVP